MRNIISVGGAIAVAVAVAGCCLLLVAAREYFELLAGALLLAFLDGSWRWQILLIAICSVSHLSHNDILEEEINLPNSMTRRFSSQEFLQFATANCMSDMTSRFNHLIIRPIRR